MNRPIVAWIVAPLWVPAAAVPFAVYAFPYPGQFHWVLITLILAAVFTYLGMFALGIPAARILRSFGVSGILPAIGLGFIAGELTWALFGLCFGLFLGEGIHGFEYFFTSLTKTNPIGLLVPATLGALVGATFWIIARPDRSHRRGELN